MGEDCSDDRILEDMQVVAFVSLDSIRFIFDPEEYFRNRKFIFITSEVLDKFYLRWLQNDVIKIVEAASIPLIIHHRK